MANGSVKLKAADIRRYNYLTNEKNERLCAIDCHEDKFVLASEFPDSEMKRQCQKMNILELVNNSIQLSVRVEVRLTEPSQGRNQLQESVPEMYSKFKNVVMPHTGSGIIKDIYTNESSSESQVEVCTAMHVVFNDEEAKNTKCSLYFDGEGYRTVILTGINESGSNISSDWCKFLCKVDSQKIDEIKENFKKFETELGNKKRKKMNRKRKVILISHPHGGYKYISMGDQIIEKDGIRYDTPSCKGCSGGYIIPVGYIDKGTYVHSGSSYENGKRMYGYASGLIPVVKHGQ
ncbi:hypothetical protein BgiMline_034463 [Biomphalaria glabrata]|uniref:Uncharacterized protein LOC129923441 n=1 Tax=Biomphalaria glabrata TaxID=6526 RepID=A0A9W2Z5M9_BIOGL|nr:uncharacterized protein LOC129923441 [Biomphalaria glabrata]KAI8745219.1 hypothetical protein BgiMline_020619 [Biomphalaria glabrata]